MDIPQGYKQTELGIIPDDWEVKRISDFTSIITGVLLVLYDRSIGVEILCG